MQVKDIIIRPFNENDRESVRRICAETAFMGESADNFFDDKELFADFAISYYTDYEPESLFVAEYKDKVLGYLAGCGDSKRCSAISQSRILPQAILKSIQRGVIFKPKTRRFILNVMKSFVKGEFKRPCFFDEYPAHLHINVDKDARSLGIGVMLMNKFLEYLRGKNIPAVHLSSVSKIGQVFFSKSGFNILYSQRMTYFDYLVKEPVNLVYFGKKL